MEAFTRRDRMYKHSMNLGARCRRDVPAVFGVPFSHVCLGSVFFLFCLLLFPPRASAQVAVTISPTSVNLAQGGTAQFTATVTGTTNTAVTWSVLEGTPGGTVTSGGLYTAPLDAGAYHVVATSQADTSQSATAIAAVPGLLRPDMRDARVIDTATTLQDGRVLFAGGQDNRHQSPGQTIATAEIYDPTSGTFAYTGNMTITRDSQAAALLANGQVLIAGGETTSTTPSGDTATAELYDPESGTFTATGSMAFERAGPTATTLPNGKVLIIGGANCDSSCVDVQTAELYDPFTGAFSSTGNLITARFRGTRLLCSQMARC
jgi:hypothetical protein